MDKVFIGCDPGLSGAIAFIYEDNSVYILATPVAGKEIDAGRIAGIIDTYTHGFQAVAYIEKVHSMPEQGVSSSFKFGFVTGLIHGIFRALYVPLYEVTPQAWKKEILAGTDKSKQASIDWSLRAYPNVELFRTTRSRTYDDGMSDALCIAEYAKRKHQSTKE